MEPRSQLAAISGRGLGGREGLLLGPSEQLDRFLEASASQGLDPAEATRLALKRFFALADGAAFGMGDESVRRVLNEAARGARPRSALPTDAATRVRRLLMPVPIPLVDVSRGIKVPLEDRLLTRIEDHVPARALDPSGVEEMVRWEVAATLDGRTMGEWALVALMAACS